ncbi:UV DNA damage repair endonuclease UvsE [Paenibacillus thermotolerans]|uniref:UV DNA damage repair endonuclease UvsE n=1 Tax=Paenibacillus thermotolerans TaxID=3027807 RepID=UPI002368B965|nr:MULTISPECIES: UV DNA damage repair endonuclease UvsE [unclassified Paenibacillus]
MIVRFGYVAMSVHIKNASPSKTMTATHFQALTDREAAVRKLERIAEENLGNTLRLLRHNKAEEIKLYRLSSRLIPLLTHELLAGWDPLQALEPSFREIGDYAKLHGMRLSFHPDHFTVLSTPRAEVLEKSKRDLEWHVRMMECMGLDERYKCNIHIGGAYNNKDKALERFIVQMNKLPDRIRHRLTLENDDKTFNARETLEAAKATGVPMVLDIHHHWVNNDGERAEELWPDIRQTWEREKARFTAAGAADTRATATAAIGANAATAATAANVATAVAEPPPAQAEDAPDLTEQLLTPKIHVSSPKSDKDPRGHADYVDPDFFLEFAKSIAATTPRLDVMIEAKQKDDALFTLMKELEQRPGIVKLGGASIEL